jgi:hypothetical protein
MTRAKGSFDFLRSECVVGTAFSVERTYFGGQFASGEGVTLDYTSRSVGDLGGSVMCLWQQNRGTHVWWENDRGRRKVQL